jgi:hypothetical protein
MTRRLMVLGVVATLIAGGCSRTPEPADASKGRKAGTGSTTRFTLVGGFAGFDLELVVAGQAVTLRERGSEVRSRSLSPAEAEQLATALAAAAPAGDTVVYQGQRVIADGMTWTVSVTTPERHWSATVSDPPGGPPASLQALFDLLMELGNRLRVEASAR